MALLMSSYTFFSSTSLCNLSISRNKTPKLQKCSKVVRNGLIKAVDWDVYKDVISKAGEDPSEGLDLVNSIQRLGIDYIFEEEINEILRNQYMLVSNPHRIIDHDDLREVSLRFRLLRQQGYFVPSDIFNNFKDQKGVFKEKIKEDIDGLIGLYEASQVRIDGEFVLDEAELLSARILNSRLSQLDDDRSRIVTKTLKHPCHKSLAKINSESLFGDTSHISKNGWTKLLQELAKVEFNKRQSLYKWEIDQILRWWRDMGLAKELTFAREQPLKWYIWSMACLEDTRFSRHRVELTKCISFIYIIDDIFDVHGTLDELTRFTEAINRWDINSIDNLPDYMKTCFKALDSLTNEMSYHIYQKHGWNPLHSLQRTWAGLCDAFLVEAKWFASRHVPSTEEYLRNGVVSSGVHVVLVHIFFLLGKGLNEDTVNFVVNMPGIVTSTAAILRLWDDMGSAKDENQNGHDGSYMQCYMKERQEASVEEAQEHMSEKISESWKCLNKECLISQNSANNSLPPAFVKASLNLARLVPLMYSYDDNQCLPSLEEYMKSKLYEYDVV